MTDFNAKIRDHLTKQKARAFSKEHSSCAYLDQDGNKCAVGCLIPEDKYNEKFEGLTVQQATEAVSVDYLRGYLTPEQALSQWERYQEFKSALPEGLDPAAASLWQVYHDDARTLDGVRFSYGAWVEGDEAHSPAAFHDALIKYLADKVEVQGE